MASAQAAQLGFAATQKPTNSKTQRAAFLHTLNFILYF
jgi:hypothetical protein